MMKKFVSVFLAVCMMCSVAAAFAEDKLEHIVFARDGHKLQAVCEQITFRRGAGSF
jgi:hypothetical protein